MAGRYWEARRVGGGWVNDTKACVPPSHLPPHRQPWAAPLGPPHALCPWFYARNSLQGVARCGPGGAGSHLTGPAGGQGEVPGSGGPEAATEEGRKGLRGRRGSARWPEGLESMS